MDMQKLQQKIAQINELIANETADVGLDIIAAALSHAIVSWVASDLMSMDEVHAYLAQMEDRIRKILREQGIKKKETLKVRREKNA